MLWYILWVKHFCTVVSHEICDLYFTPFYLMHGICLNESSLSKLFKDKKRKSLTLSYDMQSRWEESTNQIRKVRARESLRKSNTSVRQQTKKSVRLGDRRVPSFNFQGVFQPVALLVLDAVDNGVAGWSSTVYCAQYPGKTTFNLFKSNVTMHTVWVRLNAVVFFGLSALLGFSVLAAISKIGHSNKYVPREYYYRLANKKGMRCTWRKWNVCWFICLCLDVSWMPA